MIEFSSRMEVSVTLKLTLLFEHFCSTPILNPSAVRQLGKKMQFYYPEIFILIS